MSRRYATEKTLCQSKIGQGLSALIGAPLASGSGRSFIDTREWFEVCFNRDADER